MDLPLLLLAVGPALVLLAFFYRHDETDPAPTHLVLATAAAGAVSAAIALYIGHYLRIIAHDFGPVVYAFVIVGFTEELCKMAAVLLVAYTRPTFDEPYDGVTFCVAAGLGFAMVENVGYLAEYGYSTGVLRALLTVPGHALFGVSMGYFVGQARFTRRRPWESAYLAGGLASAAVMHGLFNYLVNEHSSLVSLLLFPAVGAFWLIGLWQVDRNASLSPFRYRDAGTETGPMQRRSWIRFRVGSDAEVVGAQDPFAVWVADIGMGGARIDTGGPIDTGQAYTLTRLGEDNLRIDFDLVGQRDQKGAYIYHCRFATMSWRKRKRLELVLRRLLEEGRDDET
ncbi:MAG: PrsW family intramembrane metalloprotease [Armatimonadetes bacterium]|nr:PrsW family intramembrane metalloprotease [Armatimonadota bacterium]